ncbi:MAG: hypothetical protein WD670_01940, partial [Actinomycetota bacterium]
SVQLTAELLDELDLARLRGLFDESHGRAYGYSMADPVEVAAYRIRGVGAMARPRRPEIRGSGNGVARARKGQRTVTHRASGGTLDWDVYDRALLPEDGRIEGPAIVEETSSTVLVPPGSTVALDAHGNLLITVK